MKLVSLTAKNFASYLELTLDFEEGLSLISGPTGAGKSTVMDVVCWGLFGQTAKDGSADDIRSWLTPYEPTSVEIEFHNSQGSFQVTRIRGSANRNDLFWFDINGIKEKIRGKDLKDSQKLLNSLLGVDFDRYAAASYFHEFSPSASFFTATAKTRRQIFENIATLDLPIQIAEATTLAKREATSTIRFLSSDLDKLKSRLDTLQSSVEGQKKSAKLWSENKARQIAEFRAKQTNFEKQKQKHIEDAQRGYDRWEESKKVQILDKLAEIGACIKTIDKPKPRACGACGQEIAPSVTAVEQSKLNLTKLKISLNQLKDERNPYADSLAVAKNMQDQYEDIIGVELTQKNPFIDSHKELLASIEVAKMTIILIADEIKNKEKQFNSLQTLNELSFDLRAALLLQAVLEIQNNTNEYLNKYFDSEIKVTFELEGSDSLKVDLEKSGYRCAYKQLSKGQRGLLRLCFSVSLMKATSNSSGIHFDNLMFDESLDGLDSGMKIKAFRLFEELATQHSSVLVIDHCEELKELFTAQYHVTMEADASRIVLE